MSDSGLLKSNLSLFISTIGLFFVEGYEDDLCGLFSSKSVAYGEKSGISFGSSSSSSKLFLS